MRIPRRKRTKPCLRAGDVEEARILFGRKLVKVKSQSLSYSWVGLE